MQCSVGLEIGHPCSGDGIFDVTLWSEQNRTLLHKRVAADIDILPVDIVLNTICDLHCTKFISQYAQSQLDYGCCFKAPSHSANLLLVEEWLEKICESNFTTVLESRRICGDCRIKLLKQSSFSSIVGESYNFERMQLLLEIALFDHTRQFIQTLRPNQAETLFYILSGSDVFCLQPTGSGKTMPMILAGFIKAKLTGDRQISVIIQPLNKLMGQTFGTIQTIDLGCGLLCGESIKDGSLINLINQTKQGDPIYLLSNPENLETSGARTLFRRFKVSFLHVDEAHTVSAWSEKFRPAFGRIGNLRSYIDAPMALYSATVAKSVMPDIIEATRLDTENLQILAYSPDRPEIFLEFRKRGNFEASFAFLKKEVEEMGIDTPRTIVFLHSTANTTEFNLAFRESLKNGGQIFKEDGTLDDYICNHLSSSTDNVTAENIERNFADPASCLRVLFTTICYGLGMDNPTIQRVILYDMDRDPASILQKIGRAARSPKSKGHAIIFGTSGLRKLIPKGACIRDSILMHLQGYKSNKPSSLCKCNKSTCNCLLHNCCIVCDSVCKCGKETKMDIDNESGNKSEESDNENRDFDIDGEEEDDS